MERKGFLGRKVLVLGAGISGMGAMRALAEVGAFVTIIDESQTPELLSSTFVAKFDLVVTSPSVAPCHKIYEFARQNKIEILGEAELGAALFFGTVIGITGTNGKTTTTALLGDMVIRSGRKTAVCGNIGKSFSEAVVFEKPSVAVVELSSFQLEVVQGYLKPSIALFLNLSPDHLDRHGTMDAYANAKKNIAKNQTKDDYLLLGSDDIPSEFLKDFKPKSNILHISTIKKTNGAYLQNGKLYFGEEYILHSNDLSLKGKHNVANALFAICSAKLLGISNRVICESLTKFSCDNHRIQFVKEIGGKRYYNDSKGTNVGASLAAVKTMQGDTALILGGKDKGYEFDSLFYALPKTVNEIFVIGEVADSIVKSAKRAGFCYVVSHRTLEDAVKAASETNVKNVLLSPACSSFDMFADYKARGKEFERIVGDLCERL